MLKDTLQISAELIQAALSLHSLKIRRKWHLGDQFCVTEDSELFWQNFTADCVYIIDIEILSIINESNRQRLSISDNLERMVFIPRLEDIVDFCAASVLTLNLHVEQRDGRPSYQARIDISQEEKFICEETSSGLRVAALRALVTALQSYFIAKQPVDGLPTPI